MAARSPDVTGNLTSSSVCVSCTIQERPPWQPPLPLPPMLQKYGVGGTTLLCDCVSKPCGNGDPPYKPPVDPPVGPPSCCGGFCSVGGGVGGPAAGIGVGAGAGAAAGVGGGGGFFAGITGGGGGVFW